MFSPSFVDARLQFRHLDEKERGRVSSFEALAGCYLTSRNWDESSEKLLVTALFQVFDRSSKGSLSQGGDGDSTQDVVPSFDIIIPNEAGGRLCTADAVKKIFGDKKNGSGRRSGRASLADLLRWVRGGDEVQTFVLV